MQRRYATSLDRVVNLAEPVVQEMATLYLQNFDGSSDERFRADLFEKDEVILLYCDDRIVGFTTLKYFERAWLGSVVRVVYSGDTIVAPDHWGQQALPFSWIARVGQVKQQQPARMLFWFLLVKGHRTFRYLSAFSKSFFPHWELDRSDLKPLADQLALERFGKDYKPETGLVQFSPSHGHLREAIANATREEMAKPEVEFFFRRNPRYREGHELVCICELNAGNLRPLAARVFQRNHAEVECP